MYNDQKTKNEGQTICTRHAYVQWSEDKERRTDNMYNDQKTKNEGQTICTMIRRQRTKDKQYVQWSEDKERRTNNMYNDQKTKNEGQTRIYKILHKKWKIEKLASIKNRGWTQVMWKGNYKQLLLHLSRCWLFSLCPGVLVTNDFLHFTFQSFDFKVIPEKKNALNFLQINKTE
jgi:hypothetical protein